MYGRDTGSLNMYIKTNDTEKLVWSDHGNQGNRWLFGQTPLRASSTYKVIIIQIIIIIIIIITIIMRIAISNSLVTATATLIVIVIVIIIKTIIMRIAISNSLVIVIVCWADKIDSFCILISYSVLSQTKGFRYIF